jgi:N-acetylglucosaminyldiphosphoundecaprenol N-acetyl-beta-D-mannosaminyltransferase
LAPKETGLAEILGVPVSPLRLQNAIQEVSRYIETREPSYICVASVHGLMEAQSDEHLMGIFDRASIILPDGKPLSVVLKAKGHPCEQIRGIDFTRAILERSLSTGWSHFFYGTTERNLEFLSFTLRRDYPGINIAGSYAPPFRALSRTELVSIAEVINAAEADIIWVGLSTPKQEEWMDTMRSLLRAPVLVGVGAVFDFLSGNKRQAPRAVRTLGFEWLYRMAQEPRRLGPRYLRHNPAFLWALVRDYLRRRRS